MESREFKGTWKEIWIKGSEELGQSPPAIKARAGDVALVKSGDNEIIYFPWSAKLVMVCSASLKGCFETALITEY